MATPYTKQWPKWLDNKNLSHKRARSTRYYTKLFQAWPEWCAADPEFKRIYQRARVMRQRGFRVNVDHIVPLCSDIVCGLHVPWNLTYLVDTDNFSKGNTWWQHHPFENRDLFDET